MRLIDADELKSVFAEKSTEAVCGTDLCKAIISRIDDTPTVDIPTVGESVGALPVRHGKWIDEGYYADNTNVKAWHCSECNWHMLGYEDELFRYCPMCGARMDDE